MNNHWATLVHQLNQQNVAYVLVTILGRRGSAPRDSGTKMIVTADTSYATIGGGQLEFKAIEHARNMLNGSDSDQHIEYYPLGPKLGQCCGGSTTVLYEHFAARATNVMLFGAGHVGHALTSILSELPIQLAWVDSRSGQFLESSHSGNIRQVISANPAAQVATMPASSYYLIMTHDHQLDFDLCCAVLERADAQFIGLIGSNTKWLRFKKRLSQAGFSDAQIDTIQCPIGLSNVEGKLPMEVAVSISGQLIEHYQSHSALSEEQSSKQLSKQLSKRLSKQLSKQQGIQWKELNLVSDNSSIIKSNTTNNINSGGETSSADSKKDCDTCTACK